MLRKESREILPPDEPICSRGEQGVYVYMSMVGSTGLDGQGFLEQLFVIEKIQALELNAADFGGSFYNPPEGVFIFDGEVTVPADTRESNNRMNVGCMYYKCTIKQFHQAFVHFKPGHAVSLGSKDVAVPVCTACHYSHRISIDEFK